MRATCPQRGNRYETEEERREGYLNTQSRYAGKMWWCSICNCETSLGNKTRHLKSKKHRENKERRDECLTCSSESE
jgi:hypothetical protein